VVEDTSKFPYSIPCVISLDVVNDVVVGNDFFVLIVDEAFELYTFGLLLEVVFIEVVVDKGNDFGPVSCTIVLGWHKESAVKHLVRR